MSEIKIHQRVQLAGSGLTGTTISKSILKVPGKVVVISFQVKWDSGRTGTVKEIDLEPYIIRSYKHQNA